MKKSESKFFSMVNKGEGRGEVLIYESIGAGFFEEGLAAKTFAKELKALGDITSLDVRINSPGGSVFEGQAIYSQIKNHKARKTVYVDGIAASIASVIAMAGDEIVMPENSMMMIHDPAGAVMGTQADMEKMADTLGKIRETIVSVYEAKTGLGRDAITKLMAETTWLTAKEAVSMAFADTVTPSVEIAAYFDLSQYANSPKVVASTFPFQDHLISTLTTTAAPGTWCNTGVWPKYTLHNNKTEVDPMPENVEMKTEEIISKAFKAGTQAEEERVKNIIAFQKANFPEMADLALSAIEMGISLEVAQQTMKERQFKAINASAPESAGGGSEEVVTSEEPEEEDVSMLSVEERGEKTWNNDAAIRAEFAGNKASYMAFLKHFEAGSVKIKTGK